MLINLHKIATNADWAMRQTEHATMMKIIERADDMPRREGYDVCGNSVEFDSMQVIDGTAIIPIKGVMVHGLKMAEKIESVVCMEDVEKDIMFAIESDDVKRIVFDIDSPGGMYSGTPELGALIAQYRDKKPMAAFTNGLMASAAYWSGSAAGLVLMSQSSFVGSIGVVSTWVDTSKAVEGAGLKVQVFSSGEYKGITPEVALTEAQIEQMQARVMSLAEDFYSHVRGARAGVNEAVFDGRTFTAKEAIEYGLADGTARNVGEVIRIMELREQVAALESTVSQLIAQQTRSEAAISALTEQLAAITPAQPEQAQGFNQDQIMQAIDKRLTEHAASVSAQMSAAASQAAAQALAATGLNNPVPNASNEPLTPQQRTEQHYLGLARKMKGIE